MPVGDVLEEQPVGADDLRPRATPEAAVDGGMIDDDEMIADRVEGAEVTSVKRRRGGSRYAPLLEEDAVAQALCTSDLVRTGGEAHFEIADPAQ